MDKLNKSFLEDRYELKEEEIRYSWEKGGTTNLEKILKKEEKGLMRNFPKLLLGPTLPLQGSFQVHIVPRLASDQGP